MAGAAGQFYHPALRTSYKWLLVPIAHLLPQIFFKQSFPVLPFRLLFASPVITPHEPSPHAKGYGKFGKRIFGIQCAHHGTCRDKAGDDKV
jgi:hypothetical protein